MLAWRPEHNTYPSDLPNAQWAPLEPLIPPAKPGGRPRSVTIREVLNAILSWSRRAAHGAIGPMTCHLGQRSMRLMGAGREMERGSGFLPLYTSRSVPMLDGKPVPAPQSSSAKAAKRRTLETA